MNKKNKVNYESLERVYVINVRSQVNVVPRYRRTEKAIKTIKEFIAKHMKIPERNLKNVRLDRYLNEYMWGRGIQNPPMHVKVKAVREKDIVRVELAEMPKDLEFKKKKEEKRHTASAPVKAKKVKEDAEAKTEDKEKKEEAKEKEKTSAEATEKLEKAKHKEAKHEAMPKTKPAEKKDHSKGKQGH
ncbi:50S ribosomal protein L31e [uncultured archaeon]|nr:50S ribosomal protein L31e [uncultured archaeon]